MRASRPYHRIMIDLDLTGGPIGVCVETNDGIEVTSITVLEQPGPFDTPLDCLADAVAYIDGRYGRHVLLL